MNNSQTDKNNSIKRLYPSADTKLYDSFGKVRPSDISHRNEVTKKKLIKTAISGAIKYTAMLACFLVFLGSAGYIASYAIQYMEKKQESAYFEQYAAGNVQTMYANVASPSKKSVENVSVNSSMPDENIENIDIENKEYNEYFEKKRSMILGLQRSYPDVWGWIEIPGTGIDYVIMQGSDNNEYLYLNYNGKYTRYGSIFADYRCSRTLLDNKNVILYGHNMNTAHIMFAPLLDFAIDEQAFRDQVINVITPDGLYTYTLFSIYDTRASYNYIETYFETDEEFMMFVQRCKDKSYFKKDVNITKDSKLITLSTCTVRGDGMRWALHGVLTGISR